MDPYQDHTKESSVRHNGKMTAMTESEEMLSNDPQVKLQFNYHFDVWDSC